MNVTLMRNLDRWVGTPLCLALTLVRKATDAITRGRAPRTTRPDGPVVLIVKLAEMGSTVLAVPALQRIREILPGARLHYLCLAENRSVLDILPGIEWDGVHGLRGHSPFAFVADVLRTLWTLRRLGCDVAINFEFFSRGAAALTFLSGAPVRIGMHRFRAEGLNCGDLFTHRVSFNNHLHTSSSFLSLVQTLAAPPDELPLVKRSVGPIRQLPRHVPCEQDQQSVISKLAAAGWPAETRPPIVILNTNASDIVPLRRWPMDRFLELARRCLAWREDVWVVFTGAPGEAPAVASLVQQLDHSRVVSLAGKTTLRELLALYAVASVMVTNDSGPGHFAALTPMRTVVMFGPETPELYGPIGSGKRSLTAGLACSPCIHVFNVRHSPCRDNACMQAITVEQVFDEIREALDSSNVAADRG